jgi:hypothetical protein
VRIKLKNAKYTALSTRTIVVKRQNHFFDFKKNIIKSGLYNRLKRKTAIPPNRTSQIGKNSTKAENSSDIFRQFLLKQGEKIKIQGAKY